MDGTKMSDDRSWIDLMNEAQENVLAPIRAGECGCHLCIKERGHVAMHMVVCKECGNKRCPQATDHNLACSRSNKPGQIGSIYA